LEQEGMKMPVKDSVKMLSIYIPKTKLDRDPIARLERLAKERDRSVNYLVVEAILEYLDQEAKN
jgi:predicted transcriptional regulator